jgi:hypothetical protein
MRLEWGGAWGQELLVAPTGWSRGRSILATLLLLWERHKVGWEEAIKRERKELQAWPRRGGKGVQGKGWGCGATRWIENFVCSEFLGDAVRKRVASICFCRFAISWNCFYGLGERKRVCRQRYTKSYLIQGRGMLSQGLSSLLTRANAGQLWS